MAHKALQNNSRIHLPPPPHFTSLPDTCGMTTQASSSFGIFNSIVDQLPASSRYFAVGRFSWQLPKAKGQTRLYIPLQCQLRTQSMKLRYTNIESIASSSPHS